MKWCRLVLVTSLFLALGCGGGTSTTTTPRSSGKSEFANLCMAVGAQGGQITREQFIAKSKDKETAAKLFDACDANMDRILSEVEANEPTRMQELKRQVIRQTTP